MSNSGDRTNTRLRHFAMPLATVIAGVTAAVGAHAAGTLFVSADTESPSQIGLYVTNGPSVVSGANVPVPYQLNGLGEGGGFLYAGRHNDDDIRRIDLSGVGLTLDVLPFAPGSNNEDMAGDGSVLWHANYSGTIRRLDPQTYAVLETYSIGFQPVGIALVGDQLWITKWGSKTAGRYDPQTNVYTPVITTPGRAGALAYDPTTQVMWVGQADGGAVLPYDLNGTQLGPGFIPFTDLGGTDTVDGMAFIADSDADAVLDPLDNCSAVANADQRDSNGDGFGNVCDADLNGDCVVNFADLGIMKGLFFGSDPDADLNGDGAVNFGDLAVMKARFFLPPGPSGVQACD